MRFLILFIPIFVFKFVTFLFVLSQAAKYNLTQKRYYKHTLNKNQIIHSLQSTKILTYFSHSLKEAAKNDDML